MRTAILAATLALLPLTVQGAELNPCDWRASAEMIVEPWQENTATSDDIRIALIDTAEPAFAAFHLLVLSPDEQGGRQCNLLSAQSDEGFAAIDFDGIEIDDVPDGQMLAISTFHYNDGIGAVDMENPVYLHLIINREAGTIRLEEGL